MGSSTDPDALFPTADRSLVAQVRRGGRDAFDTLWLRHGPAVAEAAGLLAPGCDTGRVAEEVRHELRIVLQHDGPRADPVRVRAYRLLRELVGAPGSGCAETDSCTTVLAFESLAAADRELLWYADVEPVGYGVLATVCGIRPSDALAALAGARRRFRERWALRPGGGTGPAAASGRPRRPAEAHGTLSASACPCARSVEQAWGPDRSLREALLLVVLGLPPVPEDGR